MKTVLNSSSFAKERKRRRGTQGKLLLLVGSNEEEVQGPSVLEFVSFSIRFLPKEHAV